MHGAIVLSTTNEIVIPFTIEDRDAIREIRATVARMDKDERVSVLEKRVTSIENNVSSIQSKLAYYAGGLAVIVVLAEAFSHTGPLFKAFLAGP